MTAQPATLRKDRPRVLLVDDEAAVLRGMTRLLTAEGYDVDPCDHAPAAAEKLGDQPYDVIVSDLSMPGMSGLDLLRTARNYQSDVPFILVTAAPSTESAVSAIEHGVFRYLVKPVTLPDLDGAIQAALTTGRRRFMPDVALAQQKAHEELDQALSRAIAGINMAYQPIVAYGSRRLHGYEALVRTTERTFPHPGALFDAAECTERIEELGRAIRANVPLHAAQAPEGLLFFVNLHTRDLNDPDLYDRGAPLSRMASRVVLELTERASLSDVADVHARIGDLRAMGYRIAIDDIGAGYSGLTSFAMLEPDVVKLDMALVRDIHKLPTKQRLVQSLTALCRDLNIHLVAEGVETALERDMLVSLGCELFQGYLFGKPGAPFVTPVY
jgi:EAL domain-containing protein (putative c-di-GMP-specific phosphodiesterase class I)